MGRRGPKSAEHLASIAAHRRRSSNNHAPSSSDRPPAHLSDATKRWWSAIVRQYQLGEHELRTLQAAAEAWDRKEQARELLSKAGSLSYEDSRGMRRALPEVQIERDARVAYLRAMRELNLNVEVPDHNRNVRVGLSWRDMPAGKLRSNRNEAQPR